MEKTILQSGWNGLMHHCGDTIKRPLLIEQISVQFCFCPLDSSLKFPTLGLELAFNIKHIDAKRPNLWQ